MSVDPSAIRLSDPDGFGCTLSQLSTLSFKGRVISIVLGKHDPHVSQLFYKIFDPSTKKWDGWYLMPFPENLEGENQTRDFRVVDQNVVQIQNGERNNDAYSALADEDYLYLMRLSKKGQLLFDRFMLDRQANVNGLLTSAVEVRYQNSGLKGVPVGEYQEEIRDTLSCRDDAGKLFIEPTLCWVEEKFKDHPLFSAALVPTDESNLSKWAIVQNRSDRLVLHVLDKTDETPLSALNKQKHEFVVTVAGKPMSFTDAPTILLYEVHEEFQTKETITSKHTLQRFSHLMICVKGIVEGKKGILCVDWEVGTDQVFPSSKTALSCAIISSSNELQVLEHLDKGKRLAGAWFTPAKEPHSGLKLQVSKTGQVHLYYKATDLTDNFCYLPFHTPLKKTTLKVGPLSFRALYESAKQQNATVVVTPTHHKWFADVKVTSSTHDDVVWRGIPNRMDWIQHILNGTAIDDPACFLQAKKGAVFHDKANLLSKALLCCGTGAIAFAARFPYFMIHEIALNQQGKITFKVKAGDTVIQSFSINNGSPGSIAQQIQHLRIPSPSTQPKFFALMFKDPKKSQSHLTIWKGNGDEARNFTLQEKLSDFQKRQHGLTRVYPSNSLLDSALLVTGSYQNILTSPLIFPYYAVGTQLSNPTFINTGFQWDREPIQAHGFEVKLNDPNTLKIDKEEQSVADIGASEVWLQPKQKQVIAIQKHLTFSETQGTLPSTFTYEMWFKPTAPGQVMRLLTKPPSSPCDTRNALQITLQDSDAMKMESNVYLTTQTVAITDFTLELFVNVTPVNRHAVLCCVASNPLVDQDLALLITPEGYLCAYYNNGINQTALKIPHQWTHFAFRFEKDKKSLTAFMDGTLVGTFNNVPQFFLNAQFILGKQFTRDGSGINKVTSSSFEGKISLFRIWKRPLDVEEITRNRSPTFPTDSLGLWGSWDLTKFAEAQVNTTIQNQVRESNVLSLQLLGKQAVKTTNEARYHAEFLFGQNQANSLGGVLKDEWNHLAVVQQSGHSLKFNGLNTSVNFGDRKDYCFKKAFAVDMFLFIEAQPSQKQVVLSKTLSKGIDQTFELYLDASGIGAIVYLKNHQRTTAVFEVFYKFPNKTSHTNKAFHLGFSCSIDPIKKKDAEQCQLQLYVDHKKVNLEQIKTAELPEKTWEIQPSRAEIRAGMSCADASRQAQHYFSGYLTNLRLWKQSIDFTHHDHIFADDATFGDSGLVAAWRFDEKEGTRVSDHVGDNHGTLSNGKMRADFAPRSSSTIFLNGEELQMQPKAVMWQDPQPLTLGGKKFQGQLAEIRLWSTAHTAAEVESRRLTPISGSEVGLIHFWNGSTHSLSFSDDQLVTTLTEPPLSGHAPELSNGFSTHHLWKHYPIGIDGVPAVVDYIETQKTASGVAYSVISRCYTAIVANQLWNRTAFHVGMLRRKKIGQVTAKGTIVGSFISPMFFPTENLTVPYYEDPPDTTYVGTTQLSLNWQQMRTVVVSKEKSRETAFTAEYEAGFAMSLEGSFMGIKAAETETHVGGRGQHEVSKAKERSVSKEKTWLNAEQLCVKSNGMWKDETLLPSCSKRFHLNNQGFAVLKSYSGDLILIYDERTGAMVDSTIEIDLSRDPQMRMIPFPLDPTLLDINALDGHVGNQRHPQFPLANDRPCSFYNPRQAALDQRKIEQIEQEQRASLLSLHRANEMFEQTPFPLPGLISRVSFTAANATIIHTQEVSELFDTCFSKRKLSSHGAGIHLDHETTLAGFGGYFHADKMLTTTSIKVSTLSQSIGSGLQLIPEINGESSTKIWDINSHLETDQECPGKVTAFDAIITFLPPSVENTKRLQQLPNPAWLYSPSPTPDAIVLREALDTMNPTWKVEPYLTNITRNPDVTIPQRTLSIRLPEAYPKEGNRALLKQFKTVLQSKGKMSREEIVAEATKLYTTSGGTDKPDILIKYLLRYTLSKGRLSEG